MTTRRERLHEQIREEIKAIARQQMAAEGNETLSLRAIARQMEVTAPALYRYFPSRDDLITALILDAFNGLADAMIDADQRLCAERGAEAFGARLEAVMLAYRAWALAHRTDFALIYGTPIPGYEAPREITVAASARGLAVPITVLSEAWNAKVLTPAPEFQPIPPGVEQALKNLIEEQHYPIEVVPFYMGIVGWTRIHGMVMLELFDHTPPVVNDTEAMYHAEIHGLLMRIGLNA